MRLRVGFDARLLAHEQNPTGVGWYTRHLIQALRDRADISLTLYSDAPIASASSDWVRVLRRWPGLPWQQTVLPWALRRDHPAVYHSPSFSIPLHTGIPTVVTIHDLSFDRYPQYVRPETRQYLQRMVPASIRRAHRIITPSRQVAEELVSRYRLSAAQAERLRPIALGVDVERWHPVGPETLAAVRRELGLPFPYLVFVGTREPRKNLTRLVQAFGRPEAHTDGVYLVLVGPEGFSGEKLNQLIQQTPRVHPLAYVQADRLPAVVQGALGLCYVSEYEGFGLPVLEAMAVGTPVLTSPGSAMEETAGPWAFYALPTDVEDIASGLARLIEDGEERRRTRQTAIKAASRYTWTETALRTAEVYKELA